MVFEDDKEHHTVAPKELGELLKNGKIRISNKEISDKGRGDALSKGLSLFKLLGLSFSVSHAALNVYPSRSWSLSHLLSPLLTS